MPEMLRPLPERGRNPPQAPALSGAYNAPMRSEYGFISGPADVDDDLKLYGMVTGDCTVRSGAALELFGMVTGNLTVEDGGLAQVRGMVCGNTLNAGHLAVYGMIVGSLSTTSEGITTVVAGAQINGETAL